jgi:hypothetical protein
MDKSTVGDPMSPLKWSGKSTYRIQHYLASRGLPVSKDTSNGGWTNSTIRCYHLQKFSDEAQWEVVVGHYMPGTGKWTKI